VDALSAFTLRRILLCDKRCQSTHVWKDKKPLALFRHCGFKEEAETLEVFSYTFHLYLPPRTCRSCLSFDELSRPFNSFRLLYHSLMGAANTAGSRRGVAWRGTPRGG